MEQLVQSLRETDWGMDIVLKEGTILNDNNIIPTIQLIIDKCKEINKNKVLIDANFTYRKISVLKILVIAETLQRHGREIKLAFIAPHLIDHEDTRTMEIFSHNRGVFLQYFHNRDEALQWILK